MKKMWLRDVFNRITSYLVKPRVILGFTRYDGVYLQQTRISNTSYIGNVDKLDIEDNVYVGHYCVLDCSNNIIIGEGCQLSTHITIITHSSHNSIRLYGSHYIEHSPNLIGYIRGSVIIGRYSFIGAHATIMPGSKIGKGSIVGAYSLVKGEFPDYAIIAGNPARVIGDTRKQDQQYLDANPELAKYYKEWSND